MRFSSSSAQAQTIAVFPPRVTLSAHPSRSKRRPTATPISSAVLPVQSTQSLAAKLSGREWEGRCVGDGARSRKLSVRVSCTSAALRRKVFLSRGRSSSWARCSMLLLISSKSALCIGRFGDNILNYSCCGRIQHFCGNKKNTLYSHPLFHLNANTHPEAILTILYCLPMEQPLIDVFFVQNGDCPHTRFEKCVWSISCKFVSVLQYVVLWIFLNMEQSDQIGYSLASNYFSCWKQASLHYLPLRSQGRGNFLQMQRKCTNFQPSSLSLDISFFSTSQFTCQRVMCSRRVAGLAQDTTKQIPLGTSTRQTSSTMAATLVIGLSVHMRGSMVDLSRTISKLQSSQYIFLTSCTSNTISEQPRYALILFI